MTRFLALLLLLAPAALAQEVADAGSGRLRLLDKLTGEVQDLTLAQGQSISIGRLTVRLEACRYYPENPAQEAFVHLTIRDAASSTPDFSGWMTASSPALSALDHPRYDVWPLRCVVADLVLPEMETAPAEGRDG